MKMRLRDESGQTLIVTAAFMAFVGVGFMAFAMDTATLFRAQRSAQSAANAVALAAVNELANGNSADEEVAAADVMAKLNGFDTTLDNNPASVQLSQPTTGNFAGPFVQAKISMPIKTLFLGAFTHGARATVTVSATAIAGGGVPGYDLGPGNVCVNGNFKLAGNSKLNAGTGGVFDTSSASGSMNIAGGSTITANAIASKDPGTSDSWTTAIYGNNDTITVPADNVVAGANINCAPTMPVLPTAANWGTCLSDPGGVWTPNPMTFGPASASGIICYKSLSVGTDGMAGILNPGIYVINGGTLSFGSGSSPAGCPYSACSNLGGNGVFIYLTNGASLSIGGGGNINLVAGGDTEASGYGGGKAPSFGTNWNGISGANYDGIAIYSDTTGAVSYAGGSNTYLNGAIIAPYAPVSITNGSTAFQQGGIDAGSLDIEGGTTVNASNDPNAKNVDTPNVYSMHPVLAQ
jgi:hypothetical protein